MAKIIGIDNRTLEPYKQALKQSPVMIKVSNITEMSDSQIDKLKVGDIVAKKTGNQYHSYRVSYKEEKQGICLTYSDASIVETVSYDYTNGHWVYNSTDVTELGDELPSIAGNADKVLKVNSGATGVEWGEVSSDVVANPTGSATVELQKLEVNNTITSIGDSINYLTSAPTSANTSGRLIFVVLSSEPSTKYDGYLYIITGA